MMESCLFVTLYKFDFDHFAKDVDAGHGFIRCS